jgi:hypothetical protein
MAEKRSLLKRPEKTESQESPEKTESREKPVEATLISIIITRTHFRIRRRILFQVRSTLPVLSVEKPTMSIPV